jgi:heat shock protein HslJ/uncharacterized membrane protein
MHLAKAARDLDAPPHGIHSLGMLGRRLPEHHGLAACALLLGLILAALLAAGCTSGTREAASPEAPRARGAHVYTCPGDFRFAARAAGDGVLLSLYTRTIVLARMVSASGERYAGEGHVFWTNDSASLETPSGAHLNCQGRLAETPWDEARLMGSDFRAIGQEPGWTLDLAETRGIRFVTADGTTRAFTPMPTPAGDAAGGGLTYTARSEAHALTVTIRETPCRDTMSGEAMSHAVTVRLGGREYRGCGVVLRTGSLTNTHWKLTELDGRAVLASPNRREPHLRLVVEGARVAGSTGCNNILGRYEQAGDRIRFSALATTRMACLDAEANRQEGVFAEVLGQVDRFMVSGGVLTLYQGERPRARFAAVYLR